jgi:hypothetical protein
MAYSDAMMAPSLDSSDLSPSLVAKPTMRTRSCDDIDEQSPPPRVQDLDALRWKSASKDSLLSASKSTCASSQDGSTSPVPTVNVSTDFSVPDAVLELLRSGTGPPYLPRAAPAPAKTPVRMVPKAFQPKAARRKLPIGVLPGEFHRDDSASGSFTRPFSGSWRIHHADDPDLLQNPGTRYSTKLGKGTRAR